jgi:hypothetical protein
LNETGIGKPHADAIVGRRQRLVAAGASHPYLEPPLITESLTGFAIELGQKRHDALRKICGAGFD